MATLEAHTPRDWRLPSWQPELTSPLRSIYRILGELPKAGADIVTAKRPSGSRGGRPITVYRVALPPQPPKSPSSKGAPTSSASRTAKRFAAELARDLEERGEGDTTGHYKSASEGTVDSPCGRGTHARCSAGGPKLTHEFPGRAVFISRRGSRRGRRCRRGSRRGRRCRRGRALTGFMS
jgi:hypothetical protein